MVRSRAPRSIKRLARTLGTRRCSLVEATDCGTPSTLAPGTVPGDAVLCTASLPAWQRYLIPVTGDTPFAGAKAPDVAGALSGFRQTPTGGLELAADAILRVIPSEIWEPST